MAGQDRKSRQNDCKTNRTRQIKKCKKRPWFVMSNWMTKYRKPMKELNTGCTARKVVKYLQCFSCQNYSQKEFEGQPFICDTVLLKILLIEQNYKTSNFRLNCEKWTYSPHNKLTPTVVRSIRIEVQAQKLEIITLLSLVLILKTIAWQYATLRKRFGVTLTDICFKIWRFGKDNKHVEVRFTDKKINFEALKKSRKLQGSKTFSKVFLNPDYTKAEKQQQFEFRPIWKRKTDEQPSKT